jgi:hypothetical protein
MSTINIHIKKSIQMTCQQTLFTYLLFSYNLNHVAGQNEQNKKYMYYVEFLNTIFLVEKTVSFRQFPAFIYGNCLSVWSAKCWDYGALPYSALW